MGYSHRGSTYPAVQYAVPDGTPIILPRQRGGRKQTGIALIDATMTAAVALARAGPPYCNATRMGITSLPEATARSALPTTAPGVRSGSAACMACPAVGDVVNKSPTAMGA